MNNTEFLQMLVTITDLEFLKQINRISYAMIKNYEKSENDTSPLEQL